MGLRIPLPFVVGVAALSCQPTPEQREMDASPSVAMDTLRLDTAAAVAGNAPKTNAPRNRSLLAVAVSNAWLLVTDPTGARTGLDPAGGGEIKEISESEVLVDQIDNDVTGEPGTPVVSVGINHPRDGAYGVVIVGQGQPSELTVHAFSTDQALQPRIRVPLNLQSGARAEFRLQFSSVPGSRPSLEKTRPGGPE